MKKILMAVIALIMTVGAASAQKCMYVWMKDGTHLSIPVSSFDSVGFYAPTYTLSVTTEGEGSVTGAGAYKIDTEVSLTATAASGYTFSQWSDGKTDNPRIIKMERDLSLTAVFTAVGGGATGGIGLFSVSATQKVTFAPGNLQYQASTDTWRFAEHQWDMVGMGYGQTNTDYWCWCYIGGTVANSDNRNISSSTYSGWIDLFGWGTGNAPTKSSDDNSDYSTFVDWGTNPISNGGNQANMWRTLTKYEWDYLFNTRANARSKYGVGMVNGINGMIILPDEFTLPSGLTFTSGYHDIYGWQYYKEVNNYSAAEWARMESCGALFLPAAGTREGSSVRYVGGLGYYWSSTPNGTNYAYSRGFSSDDTNVGSSRYRRFGHGVRLAR